MDSALQVAQHREKKIVSCHDSFCISEV